MIPTVFLGALVLGILGMVYLPQSILGFSILFAAGLSGTLMVLFYASVIAIGSCARAESPPVLPLRSKGVVAVK